MKKKKLELSFAYFKAHNGHDGKDNYFITFLLYDMHGEYPLPKSKLVTNQVELDFNKMQNFLEIGNVPGDHDTYIRNAFQAILSDASEIQHTKTLEILGDKQHYLSTLHSISIWSPRTNAKPWLLAFQKSVIKAMDEASGDDTFYDYMPGYVDMFRQACSYFGAYQLYNDTIKPQVALWEAEDGGESPLWLNQIIELDLSKNEE